MSNSTLSLMKTCSICGQQKPLTAFLELTGLKGAVYGNICASCRKALKDKPTKESDEMTRRDAGGSRIRANERLAGEIDKKQYQQRIEDRYESERLEKEENQTQQIQKAEKISKNERTHREKFLLNRTFLDSGQKITRDASQVFGGEQQTAKEREINLTSPVMDTQIAGKEKYKSSVFNQFKAWLGGAAPISQKSHPSVTIGEHRKEMTGKAVTTQKTEQKKPSPEKENKESLTELIEKKWGPRR